ncbi:MAG: hypothetical protein ABW298_16720 [Candidatus Binatia bacterium]
MPNCLKLLAEPLFSMVDLALDRPLAVLVASPPSPSSWEPLFSPATKLDVEREAPNRVSI